MKTTFHRLTVFLALLVVCIAGSTRGISQTSGSHKRPAISDTERALDMLLVQNTMSKHAAYHAAGLQLEELADIWVKEDGVYAKTATFSNPTWIMQGLPVVKKYYGIAQHERKVKALEELNKIYPEVKNVPENLGAGTEWVIHTQTTPIIEIAGDGKTAKGTWYSPGIGLMPTIKDGKVTVGGTMFWEKYGVDFAKEDGKWKIWHMQMFYDYTPQLDGKWTEVAGEGAAAKMAKGQVQVGEQQTALRPGTVANPYSYEPWSPTRIPAIVPKFPEPYYTFSETFSY